MRLGENLVSKGIIGNDQLKEALAGQLIYGGHLGTCLIELGYLTERLLGRILSETMGVGYASCDRFERIPAGVIARLSPALAERHQAVPFRLRERTLDVAMVDPTNLAARDELSFACGRKMQSWVAPEARVFQALERYYGVARRLRYVTLCRQLDNASGSGVNFPVSEYTPSPPRVPRDEGSAISSHAPQPAVALMDAPTIEIDTGEDPLRCVAMALAGADTREELGEAVLTHGARDFRRCVLFDVKNGLAKVWSARGLGVRDLDLVRFQVTEEPIFGLLNGEAHYRGPIPDKTPYRGFFEELGMGRPREALLMPIYLDDRLDGMFYADNGADAIDVPTEPYRRLMNKLSLALRLIFIKQKVRYL